MRYNPWSGTCVMEWIQTFSRYHTDGSVRYTLNNLNLHMSEPAISVIEEKAGPTYAFCYDCQEVLRKPSEVLIHLAEHDITRPLRGSSDYSNNIYGAEDQIFEWLRLMGEDSFVVHKKEKITHVHTVRHGIRY